MNSLLRALEACCAVGVQSEAWVSHCAAVVVVVAPAAVLLAPCRGPALKDMDFALLFFHEEVYQ